MVIVLQFWDRTELVNHISYAHLSGDESVKYSGSFKLGARVTPGFFAQTHAHPEFIGKTLVEILWEEASLQLGPAKSVLSRYELNQQSDQRFESLSGGSTGTFPNLVIRTSRLNNVVIG
jgi:ATPase subunit of ABC transporter with duplicated ATPase domains